jgi:hypothetical protein
MINTFQKCIYNSITHGKQTPFTVLSNVQILTASYISQLKIIMRTTHIKDPKITVSVDLYSKSYNTLPQKT